MKERYIFWAIMKNYFIHLKRYWFNTAMMMGGVYILFVLVFFGLQSFGATSETLEGSIVGFALWIFAIIGFSELSWSLMEEARNGTLEQLYLSPVSFRRISGYRIISSFLVNLIIILIFLFSMMVGTGYYLNMNPGVLILIFFTLLSVYGIGYILGGLSLIFKKIQAVFSIMQFVFIVLLILPVITDSPVIYFLPVSWGTVLINKMMISGYSLFDLSLQSLGILFLNSTIYLGIGYLSFGILEDIAKDKGLLGHY
ncbi:MAG: ABC transporter permease [Thermoplasmata archaeon]